MKRLTKTPLTLTTVFTLIFTSGAYAQTEPSALESLFNRGGTAESTTVQNTGTTATNASQDQLEAQIQTRLESIIGRLATPNRAPVSEELTVEDLDRLRREAERASATRQLREAEFEEIQAELEMLSFLQNTLTEIRQAQLAAEREARDLDTEDTTPEVDVAALRAQWEAEQAAEEATRGASAGQGTMNNSGSEQAMIPRLVSIRGAGMNLEAEIESARGVMQYVEPGDALADGFTVESIDTKGVVITNQTSGNRYSLIPSPPLAPVEQPEQMPTAQDLGLGTGFF